ncbi:GNAT family N-acetyltransferase [Gaetbulibacter aquiaggeris]|uniref:GNAT family N-acetyltransferase n=1 Tax=Gaetbulibacter aquiaggeris TaxID=1735373 RepID=A0ABW7MTV6_9FLAO
MIAISENIQLVEITINDHKKLMALACKIYPPEYLHLWDNNDCNWYLNRSYGLENFKEELSEVHSNYYFVLYNLKTEGLIRFVYNKPLNQFSDTSGTYLHRLYLNQESQGKGIAQQLLRWIEQKSKENGMGYIWLEAMDTKEKAIQFYKKTGFKTLSTRRLNFELMLHQYRGMYIMHKNIS